MKRCLMLVLTIVALVAATATMPALAGMPKKSELTLGAVFEKAKVGGSAYSAVGSLLVPLFGGKLLAGPQATLSNLKDQRSVGVRGELPVGIFFLGASYDYFIEDSPGLDQSAATAFAGFKSKGPAFIKLEADRVLQGRGKDANDYRAVASIGKRF